MLRSLIVRYSVHIVLILIVVGAIGVYASELDIRFPTILIDYSKLDQPEFESLRDDSHSINSVVLAPEGNILSDQITRTINIRTHIPCRPSAILYPLGK